jgi:hypothetical protein
MAKHTHVSNISIFDASKVEVREEDTTANPGGGSRSIKITIHGDENATTVITVWRGHGDEEAPELVVKQ